MFIIIRVIIILGVDMKIKVKDIDINYIQYGKGDDIILLHGWGQNIAMMKPLGDKLEKNYRITILDLPGFGESAEPKEVLNIYDYADILDDFLSQLKISNPIVMGHSFGGRISIVYASKHDVKKLVLFGSPCIRKERKISFKVKMLKKLKKVPGLNKLEGFAKKHIGSRDYKAASDMMRKILVNTVNQDLSNEARCIKAPTLLIWGDLDDEAPIDEAKELEQIIPDAGLIVFPNLTHYAYLENLDGVIRIMRKFL